MDNLKTLWTMLQEVVENEDKWYSLHEFLLESTEEDRKIVQDKLVDADYKQFYEFMDAYTFVNEEEVHMAVCEYVEFVNNRPLCMWEMWDISEIVEDYITNRNLNFEDEDEKVCEECWLVHSQDNDANTTKSEEPVILPF